MVTVYVHSWGFYEGVLLHEAIQYTQEGKTIEDACEAVKMLAEQNFFFVNFSSSAKVRDLLFLF
jgi:uroporphyrinogen-III synthase